MIDKQKMTKSTPKMNETCKLEQKYSIRQFSHETQKMIGFMILNFFLAF